MASAPDNYPASWAALRHPWVRQELVGQLEDLSAPDPRPIWKEERNRGLVAGIDQTIHFLFDDHDFDASDIGFSLFNTAEMHAVSTVKSALDPLIAVLPDGQDDEYVSHPIWPRVRAAATAALGILVRQ